MPRRNFNELRAELHARPGAAEAVAAAAHRLDDELAAHAATLAQIRRARRLTQVQLAQALGISQPEVSRVEHQADLVLSTLHSYIDAMGGELRLVAHFDDTDDVTLTIGELVGTENPASSHDEPPDAAATRKPHGKHVVAARKPTGPQSASRRRSSSSRANSSPQVDSKAVRVWAQEQGLEVSSRGRIPAQLIERYRAASEA